MANPGDSGGGATATFGTSGITGSFRRIGGSTFVRPMVDVTHLSATANLYREGDTVEYGEIEFEMLCNPAVALPSITAAAETLTVTYPKRVAASAAAATLAGTMAMMEVSTPEFVNNQANLIRFKGKWTGETPPAFTVEA